MRHSPHLSTCRARPGSTLRAWANPKRSRRFGWPSWSRRCRWGSISDSGNRWSMSFVSASSRCVSASCSASTRLERATIYYAALLVNVGCHSDAYEQAKWFGDDIAMKATKYEYEPFSMRDAIGMMRLLGSGSTPLHRFRTGLEFAISGRKEVSDMIARHAALARELGAQLGLPEAVLDALGASYERWDGRGWPGVLAGDAIPIASRVIAACRVCRGCASRRRYRCRGHAGSATAGHAVRPAGRRHAVSRCRQGVRRDRRRRFVGHRDRCRAVVGDRAHSAAMRRRALGDQPLRRPEVTVHARALNRGRRTCRRRRPSSSAFQTMRCTCCTEPDWCTTSADSAYRTRSGTSAARSAPANGNECACTPTSPSECSSNHRRSNHSPASRCSTASGSTAPATHEA